MTMRHHTFEQLVTQAKRLVAECRRENKPMPVFVLTGPELADLLRANCWAELPPNATFHGMKIKVVHE